MGDPIYYFKYGEFLPSLYRKLDQERSAIKVLEFHTREIFPSHREVTIVVNKEEDKFTGTSGGGKSLQG